jgi:anti-anti-sigma factor
VIEDGTLSLRVGANGLAWMIELFGELDLASARMFEEQVQTAQASGAERVVVDLSGLEFIDSAGAETLSRLADSARQDGGGLGIVRPSPAVEQMFAFMGLDAALRFGD